MIWQCHGLCQKRIPIRNCLILYKSITLVLILTAFFCFEVKAQETLYSFDMSKVKGSWVHAKLEERAVISTDKAQNIATVYIDVPQSGNYQFMVSLYHRWRKHCPFLYFKIIDKKGKSYSDYTFSEPRLYLDPGKGRWEYRSPSAAPFWFLEKGRAKIKFWLDAKNDCWLGQEVAMEDKVFIEKFILIPVDMKLMKHPSIQDENHTKD